MKKISKHLVLLILAALICVSSLGTAVYADAAGKWTDYVDDDDCSWYINNSVVTSTFHITTETMLASVAKMVNEGYTKGGSTIYPDFSGMVLLLDKDMDLSAHEWVPIGTDSHPFRGSIVGGYMGAGTSDAHYARISGLNISSAGKYYGLLGKVEAPAAGTEFNNLTIEGIFTCSGTDVYAGSVAGSVSGGLVEFSNIKAKVEMQSSATGTVYMGGIAGYGKSVSFTLCENTAARLEAGSAAKACVGGFIGCGEDLHFVASADGVMKNTADVSVKADKAWAGGIAGLLDKTTTGCAIFESEEGLGDDSGEFIISAGDVTAETAAAAYAGGFFGQSEFGFSANKLVYLGHVKVTGNGDAYAGGILGAQTGTDATTLSNSKLTTKLTLKNKNKTTVYNASSENPSVKAEVQGTPYVGGICGYAKNLNLVAPYVGSDAASGASAKVTVSALRDVTDNFGNGFAGGLAGLLESGSVSSGAEIYHLDMTADDLRAAGSFFGEATLTEAFTADLNTADTVKAFTLKADDTRFVGGIIGKATTKAVTVNTNKLIVDAKTSGGAITGTNVGGFFGELKADGNVSVSASVVTVKATDMSSSSVGGFAGTLEGCDGKLTVADNGTVTQAAIKVTFNGSGSKIGGFIGTNRQTFASGSSELLIEDASAEVRTYKKSTSCYVGGVIGLNEVNVSDVACSNITVSPALEDSKVGGFAGSSLSGTFSGITADQLAVTVSGKDNYIGGLGGEIGKAFSDCAITGITLYVDGSGSFAGGAAGSYCGQADKTPENIVVRGTIRSRNINNTIGGLAGLNASGATIQEFSLADALTIEMTKAAGSVVGGLVGENQGVIDAAYASTAFAFVNPEESSLDGFSIGGMVGLNNGSLKNIFRTADMSLSLNQTANAVSYVGGLVGTNQGSLAESYMNGRITVAGLGNLRVGGVVGHQVSGSVSSCYAGNKTISTTGAGTYVGGFFGRYDLGDVDYCYTAMALSAATEDCAGGFFAEYNNTDRTLAAFSGNLYIQEQNKVNSGLKTAACGEYTEFEQAAENLRAITPANLADQGDNTYSFKNHIGSSWDFVAVWRFDEVPEAVYPYPLLRNAVLGAGMYDISWYTDPSAQSPYHISTDADLLGLVALVNGKVTGMAAEDFKGKTVIVDNAIPIIISNWVAIGIDAGHKFAGTFDGNNQLIYGLYDENTEEAGFFGYTTKDAVIKDLVLSVRTVKSDSGNAGALVAANYGSIDHVTVQFVTGAEISAALKAGGVTGYNAGTITGVTVSGKNVTITAPSAGGIAGITTGSDSEISDVVVTLTGDSLIGGAAAEYAGGVAGKADSVSGDLTVHCNILAADYAGGVAGSGSAVVPETVLLRGSVTGGRYAGGLAGFLEAPVSDISLVGDDVIISGRENIGGMAGAFQSSDLLPADQMKNLSVRKVVLMTEETTGDIALGGLFGTLQKTVINGASADMVSIYAAGTPGTAFVGGAAGKTENSILADIAVTRSVVDVNSPRTVYAGGVAGQLVVTEDNDKTYKLNAADVLGVYQGLCGVTADDVSVSVCNMVIQDAAVDGSVAYAGGLAGAVDGGSIYLSEVQKGMVYGACYEYFTGGGAAGALKDAYLVNNKADCEVSAENDRVLVLGGAAASVEQSTVRYNAVAGEKAAVDAVFDLNIAKYPLMKVGGFAGEINNTGSAIVANNTAEIDLDIENEHNNTVIYAGGFVGLAGYDLQPSAMSACSAETEISLASEQEGTPVGSESYVGGFAGQLYRCIADSCYAQADITENTCAKARSGGFAGSITEEAAVSNCYAVGGTVKAHGNVSVTGGFAADNKGTITGVYADYADLVADLDDAQALVGQNHDGAALTAAYSEDLANGTFFTGFDFTSDTAKWAYAAGYNDNRPVLTAFVSETAEPDLAYFYQYGIDALKVGSLSDLGTVGALFNEPAIYALFTDGRTTAASIRVTLTADLTCENQLTWMVSVPAEAVFDGNGHTISNYMFGFAAADNAGFFKVNEGTIQNLTFSGASVKGSANAGVAVGINRGQMKNITVASSTVSGNDVVGLVAGTNDVAGTMEEIYVLADKISAEVCGGLVVGENYGTISRAVTYGSYDMAPSGTTVIFGGIAGKNMAGATIEKTMAGADLKVTRCAMTLGGIAGENSGTIENCMTAAGAMIRAITGSTVSGNVGGIVGIFREGTIRDCLMLSQVLPTDLDGNIQPEGLNAYSVMGRRISGTFSDNIYDSQLSRIADLKGNKRSSTDLIGQQVIENSSFTAQAGMYPVLTWLKDTDLGKLFTAAINFGTQAGSAPDRIDNMGAAFTVSAADGVSVQKGSGIEEAEGKFLLNSRESKLTLSAGNLSRNIVVNNKNWVAPTPPEKKSVETLTENDDVIEIVVDGEGYAIASFYEDKVSSVVTVDSDALTAKIKKASPGSQIEIPLSESFAKTTAVLTVQNIKDAAEKKMYLVVAAGSTGLTVPTAAIDTKALQESFSGQTAAEIPFFVTITRLSDAEKKEYAQQTGLKLAGDVVSFQIGAGAGNNVCNVENLDGWTARILPADKDAQITTGVEIIDGKAIHKPTNGKVIYSMTNSVYAYISNEVSFADASGKWYEDAVNEMASRLIISGYSDGSFRGEKSITRAEFASIAVNALGLTADGDGTVFTDVKADDWFCGAVGKAYELGLVSGRGAGKFDPDANITRQEAMVILEKMAALMNLTGNAGELDAFSDADQLASWAQSAAQFNVGNGIIKGSGGMLRPQDEIKRSETAISILLVLQKAGLVDVRTGK